MEATSGSLLAGAHAHPSPTDAATHVLLRREGHNIIYKQFGAGQGMAPHHAPHDVFVVVLSGKLDITVADQLRHYVAGDYVIFPANAMHSLHCLQAAQVLIYR
ncbi:cupin domain-containing protein [Hymenobacter psychrophilus]|uniref:Cupin domain-containing protein n=1 Tax=Hymenobacter psychrophilus TaxID=651662 RepID=A0A1H3K931_9BACT|nr:cupin domain-containing protein [Hymenobacter psychrophilus]SDY48409.1 Cupin domain-containing protein [Hymenobacter psychrophilus]